MLFWTSSSDMKTVPYNQSLLYVGLLMSKIWFILTWSPWPRLPESLTHLDGLGGEDLGKYVISGIVIINLSTLTVTHTILLDLTTVGELRSIIVKPDIYWGLILCTICAPAVFAKWKKRCKYLTCISPQFLTRHTARHHNGRGTAQHHCGTRLTGA